MSEGELDFGDGGGEVDYDGGGFDDYGEADAGGAATWAAENEARVKAKRKRPPLVPIGLHECRHTFVSLMADAGLPLERIGDHVGHSSTYMVDRYRHLLEGHEAGSGKAPRRLPGPGEYSITARTGRQPVTMSGADKKLSFM